MSAWIRARKGLLLLAMGAIFVVFAFGITSGLIGPNDPLAVPLALAFILLTLLVLLS